MLFYSFIEHPTTRTTNMRKRIVIDDDKKSNFKNKKRREEEVQTTESSSVFRFGNYGNYYQFRRSHTDQPATDQIGSTDRTCGDNRIQALMSREEELFHNKRVLDVGCNSGFVTHIISHYFEVESVTGVDIDENLVSVARNRYFQCADCKDRISFHTEDYSKTDATIAESYDTILLLSITKWIHVNSGDDGLKRCFKRAYDQLRPNGWLVLEPQPWHSYLLLKRKRKRIKNNGTFDDSFIKSIQLRPQQFKDYLLSPEVGFSECIDCSPKQETKGFTGRPILLFHKT